MAAPTVLERALHRIELFASAALFALMAIVFVSVSMRYLANAPLKDQFDLSRMFLGVAVFWGIAAACASDEYVRGDIFWDRLSPRARKAVDLFGRIVILVAVGVLAWQVFFKFQDVMKSGELTSELRWVIWPFYCAMFAGSALAVLGAAARFIRVAVLSPAEGVSEDAGSPVQRAVSEG